MRPRMLTVSRTWLGPTATCGSGGSISKTCVHAELSSFPSPTNRALDVPGGEDIESTTFACGGGPPESAGPSDSGPSGTGDTGEPACAAPAPAVEHRGRLDTITCRGPTSVSPVP